MQLPSERGHRRRERVEALVALSAARRRAEAEGRDPDADPEVVAAAQRQRFAATWGRSVTAGETALPPGYGPTYGR